MKSIIVSLLLLLFVWNGWPALPAAAEGEQIGDATPTVQRNSLEPEKDEIGKEAKKEDYFYSAKPEALLSIVIFFAGFGVLYMLIRRHPTAKQEKKKKKRKKL